MTILTVLVAVLMDQFRPHDKAWAERRLAGVFARFDGRWQALGVATWWGLVVGGAVLSYLVFKLLAAWSGLLAWVWTCAVLYVCIGWRVQLKAFSDVHLALSMGEQDEARRRLGFWRGSNCAQAGNGEVVRLAIEQLLLGSHRRMFGVLFWFVVLPGPMGAVLYYLAWQATQPRWAAPESTALEANSERTRFAQRAFDVLDAIPVRLTALAYSILGNFEEALYCWRAQSVLWPHRLSGILIASGAGALGIRLGLPIHDPEGVIERPAMGPSSSEHRADTVSMQAAAQLMWRVLLLWLLLLVLFGAAGLFSR